MAQPRLVDPDAPRDETATIIELINIQDPQRLAVRCRAAFRDLVQRPVEKSLHGSVKVTQARVNTDLPALMARLT